MTQPDSTATAPHRPALEDGSAATTAREAVDRFVEELQRGLDTSDADLYDAHFAVDLIWGSPYGRVLDGFAHLTEAHHSLMDRGVASNSRYEVVQVLTPHAGVALAHVRRQALAADGSDDTEGFSEMALYVLVERDGDWWLAAGQNTPVAQGPPPG